MTLRNQVLVWIGFTVVVILLIWLFRPILLPFVIGIALAYILNPGVVLLERTGINRAWSAAIVLLAVLGVIIGVFLVITPLIVTQVGGLIARLPGYVSDLNSLIRTLAPQLNEWLGPERAAQLQTQPMNTAAHCAEPASKSNARGAQNLNRAPVAFYDSSTKKLTWAGQTSSGSAGTVAASPSGSAGKDAWSWMYGQ